MFFLGVIQLVFISYICVYEYKNKSSSVFLWGTLLLMFGFMHLLTSIIGDDLFSNAVINESSVFTIIFCSLYIITRKVLFKFSNYNEKYNSIESLENSNNRILKILTILLFIIIICKIFRYIKFTGDFLDSSWGEFREYSVNLNYVNVVSILSIVFFSLSGLFCLHYFKKNYLLFILTGVMLIFNELIFRRRIEILPFICPLIAIYILKNNKLNYKSIIYFTITIFVVIYIVYGLRAFRHYGTIEEFLNRASLTDFNNKILGFIINGDGELSLRRVFYYFISNDNNFNGFGKGATYLRMLLVYVPTRFSFGLKPSDFALTMGSAIGMRAGGSTHPTLFGDCYANFNFFGSFMGIFWGLYTTIFDRIKNNRDSSIFYILHYILNSIVFVIIGRGSVYNAFFLTAYGTIFLLILEYLFKHICIKRKLNGKLSIIFRKGV